MSLARENVPHDEALERAVLGSILLENQQYDVAAALIAPEHFYVASNATIFRTMGRMTLEGIAVDVLTLSAELENAEQLSAIGGRVYLFSLTENLPRNLAMGEYAKRILELSQARQLMQLGEELASNAASDTEQLADIIGNARSRLEAVLCDSAAEQTSVSGYSIEVLDSWLAERDRVKPAGLSYGIASLDRRTGGMRPGENTTVGGDPGHGKSSMMLQAAAANCPNDAPVFLVSLEMTKAQILRRLWSQESGVDAYRVRNSKQATPEDVAAISESARRVKEWPLHIYDQSSVRLEQLTGMLRLAIRRHKVKLFAVDFVQIVGANGRDFREQITNATNELTRIAKGEGVHLMLLSQMSRKSHNEFNRAPRLSDLRESGALEQNAHCVVLIHRPWDEANGRVHTRPSADGEPGCELIIAKQREGSTSSFPVEFNSKTLTFVG